MTLAPHQYFGAVQLNATPEAVYVYAGSLESISEWLPIAGEVTQLDHAPVMRLMLNRALGNLADKFAGEVL